MARRKEIQIVRTGVAEHSAVCTWGELAPAQVVPERLEVLKRESKSFVYRLVGVGEEGTDVIAKRCLKRIAGVERAIYERVLPDCPVTQPLYYGAVEEAGRYCWLFLEDGAGERFSRHREAHRKLAARWLGTMHTSAAAVPAASELPDRGPGHYLEHLRSTRRNILRSIDNPVLDDEDRADLREMVDRLDLAESDWSRVEALCAELPRTLVHGDISGRNARVRNGTGEPVLIPFDWEMAGWGVPGVDLLHTDLAVYGSVVSDTWSGTDARTLERWRHVGALLRGALAPLSWQSLLLEYAWANREMRAMRLFDSVLRDALRATEIDSD